MRALYLLGVCFLGLVFLTPLVVAPKLLIFPFVTAKVWYMRTGITLAAACLIPLVIVDKRFRYKLSAVHYAIIVYLGVLILNVMTSVDPHVSWYSGHERMMGVLTIMHVAVIAFLLPIVARSWERTSMDGRMLIGWKDMWSAIVLIAVYTGIVGIVQFFSSGVYFNPGGGRIDASLGNPIYLGHMAAVTGIAACMLTLQSSQKKSQVLWLCAAVFLAIVMMMTGSRGAALGMFAAVVVALLLFALRMRGKSKKMIYGALIISILMPVLILTTPLKAMLSITPGTARLLSIGQDLSPRLHAWRVAYRALTEHPLLGWGYGNFYVPFNLYLEPTVLGNSFYETWFDEAHNIVMSTLATTGMLGLLAWLSIYGTAAISARQVVKIEPSARTMMIGAVAMLVADFGSKLLSFDNAVSLLLFFTVVGYIGSARIGWAEGHAHNTIRCKKLMITATSALIIGIVMVFEINVKPAIANHQTILMFQRAQAEPRRLVSVIEKLMTYDTPHKMDITHDVTKMIVSGAPWLKQQLTSEEFNRLIRVTLTHHSNESKIHPYELLRAISEMQLAKWLLPDEEVSAYIDRRFAEMIAMSPNRQQLYYEYAEVKREIGDFEEALALLDQAEAIKPDVGVTFFERSKIRAAQERWDDAYKEWEYGVFDLDYPLVSTQDLLFTARVVDRAQAPIPRYTIDLVQQYEKNIGTVPRDILILFARTLDNTGLKEMAYQVAKRVIAIHPESAAELKSLSEKPKRAINPEPIKKWITTRLAQGKTVYVQEFDMLLWMLALNEETTIYQDLINLYLTSPSNGYKREPIEHYQCIIEISQRKKPNMVPIEECLKDQ